MSANLKKRMKMTVMMMVMMITWMMNLIVMKMRKMETKMKM